MRYGAHLWGTACLLVLLVHFASSDVLRVPADYPTIGAALNAVQNDDTVLVSLGTYAEELMAPPLRFWLIGDVQVDTGDFPRPVIDPSTLDSAQWRKCLTIPDSCEITIERMKFVNRAPMYPRDGWNSGGIFVHSVEPATFRYCAFDSVYRAIVDAISQLPPPPPRVHYRIENCRFTNGTAIQIRAELSDTLEIFRSFIEARDFFARLVMGGDNTSVDRCVFTGDSINGALMVRGKNALIRNCTFGPIDTCTGPIMSVWSGTRTVIADNIVSNIWLRYWVGIGLSLVNPEGSDTLLFRHNLVTNLVGVGTYGATQIAVSRASDSLPGSDIRLDSNVFADNVEWEYGAAKAIEASTHVQISGCRFANLGPRPLPCVGLWADSADLSSGYQLRYNQFEAGDYAVHTEACSVDGIYNYWGDASGPYNATFNPQGLGARVDDAVLFDPWCPDTNCFLSVPGIGAPLPEKFIFEAYPNPFNSVLHLTLIPAEVGIVKVELFDVLGRRASEIWHGPLAFQKEITFDASALASGIYFARVTDVISRKDLAIAKLVMLR